jgi:hypothetical protein
VNLPIARNLYLPRSSPYAARENLNIMGLNTGTQSEQNGEHRDGENNVVKQRPIPPLVKKSQTVDTPKPKRNLSAADTPFGVGNGSMADTPNWVKKLHLGFTPRVNGILTLSRIF